jgi:hypothetical protein
MGMQAAYNEWMRYRLRTLLILAALAPPVIVGAAVVLERSYFGLVRRLERMREPKVAQPGRLRGVPTVVAIEGQENGEIDQQNRP